MAGHIIAAVTAITSAVWIIAYSIQIENFTHFMQILAGMASAALIVIVIRDFWIRK